MAVLGQVDTRVQLVQQPASEDRDGDEDGAGPLLPQARLDRRELIVSSRIGRRAAEPGEGVPVPLQRACDRGEVAVLVGLPDLDQGVGHRVSRAVVDDPMQSSSGWVAAVDQIRAAGIRQREAEEGARGLSGRGGEGHEASLLPIGSSGSSTRLCRRQHDVPPVPQSPLRRAEAVIVPGDQPLPGGGVDDRLIDGVEREQWVVRKVHLCDEALRPGLSEDREMNVCRPPGVSMIVPGIGAGLDGLEPIGSVGVGEAPSHPCEVLVQGRWMRVPLVDVPACGIRLPDLNEPMWDWTALLVEDAAGDDDPFPQRLADVLPGQVALFRADLVGPEDGRGELDRLGIDKVRRVPGISPHAAAIRSEVELRVVSCLAAGSAFLALPVPSLDLRRDVVLCRPEVIHGWGRMVPRLWRDRGAFPQTRWLAVWPHRLVTPVVIPKRSDLEPALHTRCRTG